MDQEPDILLYTNYRLYLKDYYEYRKAHSKVFSLRFFAEKAGLSSHAHLKLAMDGKRNITKETVTRLQIGLALTGKKAEYFENLVFFNQAKTEKEKQVYFERLVRASPKSKLRKLEETQLRLFREWYHTVVRECVVLRGFHSAPEWTSRKLRNTVNVDRVTESFNLLLELGLIQKTANGYRQTDALLTTDDEVHALAVKDYHLQMLSHAENALKLLPASQRDFSALTIPIKRKDFPALKKQLQLLRKELLNFSAEVGEGDGIVQVNIQLFPLTED